MGKFFSFGEIRGRYADLRNGPNPEIGHCAGHDSDDWLLQRFLGLTRFLKPRQCIERSEEVAGDSSVVAEIHFPAFLRPDHEAYGDGVVRIQVFGAVFDDFPRAIALGGSGDVEDAGFDATGA